MVAELSASTSSYDVAKARVAATSEERTRARRCSDCLEEQGSWHGVLNDTDSLWRAMGVASAAARASSAALHVRASGSWPAAPTEASGRARLRSGSRRARRGVSSAHEASRRSSLPAQAPAPRFARTHDSSDQRRSLAHLAPHACGRTAGSAVRRNATGQKAATHSSSASARPCGCCARQPAPGARWRGRRGRRLPQ